MSFMSSCNFTALKSFNEHWRISHIRDRWRKICVGAQRRKTVLSYISRSEKRPPVASRDRPSARERVASGFLSLSCKIEEYCNGFVSIIAAIVHHVYVKLKKKNAFRLDHRVGLFYNFQYKHVACYESVYLASAEQLCVSSFTALCLHALFSLWPVSFATFNRFTIFRPIMSIFVLQRNES